MKKDKDHVSKFIGWLLISFGLFFFLLITAALFLEGATTEQMYMIFGFWAVSIACLFLGNKIRKG